MPVLPLRVQVRPTTVPAKFGLLDTISPQALPLHGGMAGLTYDTDFCGVARPWEALPCTTPPSLGSISVSVADTGTATITGTGEPAGTFDIDWGDGNSDSGVALDGQTNAYAAPGDYAVTVTGPDGYKATVVVTVEAALASGPFVADAFDTKVPDDGIGSATGVPIQVYHLHSCRLVGSGSEQERQSRAERAIELGASRALEEGFGDVLGGEAVDITPSGTATGVVEALALLEQYGGANYGGQRYIHADNAVVTLLISQNLVREVGGHLETFLGSIVVSGPGYAASTGPSAPAAGARWMYATGLVNIWAEKIKVTETILNSDPYDNEYNVLAERVYVPTYECFAAAAEVTLEA